MANRKDRKRRVQALGENLQAMFRDLSARPMPDRIASVVDQLEGGEPQAASDGPPLRSRLN